MIAFVAKTLAIAGLAAAMYAVVSERRMQRHRQPGVDYWKATLRRDGGWRRADLFTPEGLRQQRKASLFGILAAACWIVAVAVISIASFVRR